MITAATSKYASASSDEQERGDRPAPTRRACRSRRACPSSPSRAARSASAARWKPKPAQKTTGVASANASHSQPSNCSGGAMASSDERRRERDGRDDEPCAGSRRRGRRRARASAASAARYPAASTAASRSRRRRLRIEAHRRLLGRVVHRRLDAVELVQLALDAVRARGARHALEGEVDLAPRLARRGRVTRARTPLPRSPRAALHRRAARPLTVTTFVSRSTATSSTPATSETSSRIDIAQCAQWIAGTL